MVLYVFCCHLVSRRVLETFLCKWIPLSMYCRHKTWYQLCTLFLWRGHRGSNTEAPTFEAELPGQILFKQYAMVPHFWMLLNYGSGWLRTFFLVSSQLLPQSRLLLCKTPFQIKVLITFFPLWALHMFRISLTGTGLSNHVK